MTLKPSFFLYSYGQTRGDTTGGHILFHASRSSWVKVNDSGLEIFRRLERGASVQDVCLYLRKRYGIVDEVAQRDVSRVRDQLSLNGLLGPEAAAKPSRSPKLKSVFFHLTSRCNLSCVHCYISNSGQGVAKDLPAPLVSRIIDELADNGETGVTLSGGEPLLHPEIKGILRHAASNTSIRLLTNGTLIDRKWARFLSDMDIHVQISVDGSCEAVHDRIRGKGSFRKALKGLEHLQWAGLGDRINFSTTVMNHNLDDLPSIIRLAQSLSVSLVRFLPLRRKGAARATWQTTGSRLGREDYERFYDYVHGFQSTEESTAEISCGLSGFLLKLPEEFEGDDIWCSVGRQLVISVNGDAYPCVLMMEDEFRLGNAFRDGLDRMMQSDAMAAVCRALSERREKIRKCSTCTWRNLCQAGCMGQALDETGTIWDTDRFCDYRKMGYGKAFDKILTTS